MAPVFEVPAFEITEEQRASFDRDGFLMLPGALPDDLLVRLQEADDELRSGLLADAAHPHSHQTCILDEAGSREAFRINHVELVQPELMLDLLASPPLMAIMRLLGPDCVPLMVDTITKSPDSALVRWHQGPPHSQNHPFVKVGVYLDEAPEDEDCLRFVPGSHTALQDIAAMEQEFGWDPPDVVLVPAKPGDVIIQHMMVLHSSKIRRRPGRRRTVYPQLRLLRGIAECDRNPPDWAEDRRAWMDLIVARADPRDRPPGWVSQDLYDLETVTRRMAIASTRRPTAVYATMQTETAAYP